MEEDEKIEEKVETVEVVENKTSETVNSIPNENTSNFDGNTESKGFSIAALVLGISAFVVNKAGILALACAVLAIIFGVKGQKQAGKGIAKAGMILGIVYLAWFALAFILVTVLGVAFLSGLGAAL